MLLRLPRTVSTAVHPPPITSPSAAKNTTRRRIVALALGIGAGLFPRLALPCGAPFGPGMGMPAMNILVDHTSGLETYVFEPSFCGQAASFGLILPIPASLRGSPILARSTLFSELESVTAPQRMQRTECRRPADAGITVLDGGVGTATTTVVNKGQVGIFDWALLRADSTEAFTRWLDSNGYPYSSASLPHFEHYVTLGWYFVAFRVTASEQAPGPSELLCGRLGPIQLTFSAASPVIPARIAAASARPNTPYVNWTVYAAASGQLKVEGTDTQWLLRYSGLLNAETLAANPALADAGLEAGQRLVKLDIGFHPSAISEDIRLVADSERDFRDTVYDITWVDCPDGGAGPDGSVVQDAAVVAWTDGATADAGVATDAVPNGADAAGQARGPEGSGCDCVASGASGRSAALPLILCALVALARSFRRRSSLIWRRR